MLKTKTLKKILDEDQFVTENFESLVEKYGGSTIIICRGEIFTGKNAMKESCRRFPRSIPMVLPIPRREMFPHFLL